jgi:N4-gp56 family major capsid protein
MANAYTDTSGGSLGTSLVQAAYDRYVEFALRAIPLIRDVADKRPAQQAMPGSSVVFQLYSDMAKVSSALTETTDPDAVALGNTTSVSVTLNEYGNAALATRKLELFSLSDVDPAIANIIAFNMADSLDDLAQTELRGGTNVIYSANSTGTAATGTAYIGATNTLKSADVRKAVAKLRAGKAVPRMGELYWCGIHPEVSHDLRAETGAGGWREAHVYNDSGAGQLWPGSIGTYEGAMFVESPRLYNATDGTSSGRVFRTIVAGQQALAEAIAEEPHVIIGPVVDKLMRFRPIGWYGVLGWKRYREAALYRIESSSSINLT